MDLNTLYLKALIHQAQKLPEDALPHLGTLAHLDLWISERSRCLFHRAIAGILGYRPEDHKRGMQQLLSIRELDHDLRRELVQVANGLRKAVPLIERANIRKFFRALRKATVLRDYYGLILDRFEAEGEDVMWSIMDGTAFLERSNVLKVIEGTVSPPEAPDGDGPFEPDGLRFAGREGRGFSRLAWLLLQCLWGKEDGVSIDEVVLRLYGNVDGKESAVKSVQKRLNKELRRKDFPVSVESKLERLRLVLPPH